MRSSTNSRSISLGDRVVGCLHCGDQRSKRKQDRAVTRCTRSSGSERSDSRPLRSLVRSAQPGAQPIERDTEFSFVPSPRTLLEQARGGLAEGAGQDGLRQGLDPALGIELDGGQHPAAAGRGSNSGRAVLALEVPRALERRREAQDFGRVERLVHSRRHVVPPGPSSSTMPISFMASRMASAAAKSRRCRASFLHRIH